MEPGPLSFVVMILALVLVALSAAAEYALADLNRGRIRQLAEEGDKRARRLDALVSSSSQFLLAFMLAKLLGVLLAGIAIASLWQRFPGYLTFVLVVFSLWIAIAFIQVIARSAIHGRAELVALRFAPLLYATVWLFRPLTTPLQLVGTQFGEEEADASDESVFLGEDGLRLLLNVREEEETIEESEKQMIASILDMEETVVREVMVPRIDMVAIDAETRLREALDVIISAGHSRIPVYEGNIDRIIGLLYAKDLLKCFQEERDDMPIRDLLRSTYFVPASKKLNMLFSEMQKQRVHIAVVVDEYGGTAGLVTIEDILEEIVGDIEDEYDSVEAEYIQTIAPQTYLVNARLDIDELADLLDVEMPDEHVDTLGGFMYSLLGRVPDQGESVEYVGRLFTVVSLDGRRIARVRVEPVVTATSRDEEAAEEGEQNSLPGGLANTLSLNKESGA